MKVCVNLKKVKNENNKQPKTYKTTKIRKPSKSEKEKTRTFKNLPKTGKPMGSHCTWAAPHIHEHANSYALQGMCFGANMRIERRIGFPNQSRSTIHGSRLSWA